MLIKNKTFDQKKVLVRSSVFGDGPLNTLKLFFAKCFIIFFYQRISKMCFLSLHDFLTTFCWFCHYW